MKHEIQRILMQACEIKRLREQMIAELAELERDHNRKVARLADEILAIEKRQIIKDAKELTTNA